MRIIFLDVDGVLNCSITKDRYKGMMGLDEGLIRNLEELVKKSSEKDDTRIVLSSSWRAGKDKDGNAIPGHLIYLNEKLHAYGMEIYDETPVLRYSKDGYSNHRGREIIAWLYLHRNEDIKGIVILDDVEFKDFKKYRLDPFLVKSMYLSKQGGLTNQLMEKALEILDTEIDLNVLLASRDLKGD